MTRYRITYWKHIPQSFIVEGEGRTIKKQLSQKIQDKIDTYAMVEGLTSTSDYAAQYRRGDWVECDGSPEEVAEALLSQLEADAAKIEVPRRNRNGA
ncbi:MAG: virulence factor [Chloroflexi bacterium]|nr:virulence factor [Chloroflexota bacterium]